MEACPLFILLFRIQRLIRATRTGPVVRISPNEIHLSDLENYEKIYYIGSKAPSKAGYFYNAFGLHTAAFSTPGNELHCVRCSVLNLLFSRKAV
jgi:hypothetical protein